MRRFLLLGVALGLVAAACGDDSGITGATATTTTAPSTTTPVPAATSSTTGVTEAPATTQAAGLTAVSDDGRVTIEVPPGALDGDPGISITRLAGGLPEDLAALDVQPWAYALEPGGLRFDAPVRLTVEIPFDEFASGGFEGATPLATMVVTGADGTGWELLDDQEISRDGGTVAVSGTTGHFSRLAVLSEQVFVETRFLEVTRSAVAELGVDFLWSNGVALAPPGLDSLAFVPDGSADPIPGTFENGSALLQCPPGIASVTGDLQLDLALQAVESTSGRTGLVTAPRVTTVEGAEATMRVGIRLTCRPTIATDGSVVVDIQVDHPGGAEIVPGGDFRGGLSAMYLELARAFPGLFVGLIRDVDGDGVIDPEDLMFPPFEATVDGDTTSVVLPLFGYGDYFPYFVDGDARVLDTQVTVAEGATILLGGLEREQTAVPFLADVPLLGRVFSDESRQTDEVELVVFLTPKVVEGGGE